MALDAIPIITEQMSNTDKWERNAKFIYHKTTQFIVFLLLHIGIGFILIPLLTSLSRTHCTSSAVGVGYGFNINLKICSLSHCHLSDWKGLAALHTQGLFTCCVGLFSLLSKHNIIFSVAVRINTPSAPPLSCVLFLDQLLHSSSRLGNTELVLTSNWLCAWMCKTENCLLMLNAVNAVISASCAANKLLENSVRLTKLGHKVQTFYRNDLSNIFTLTPVIYHCRHIETPNDIYCKLQEKYKHTWVKMPWYMFSSRWTESTFWNSTH